MNDTIVEEMKWEIQKLEKRVEGLEKELTHVKDDLLLPLLESCKQMAIQIGKLASQ